MDWRDIKDRLENYGNCPMITGKRIAPPKESKKYTNKLMKDFWDKCHEDRYSSFEEILNSFGLKRTDLSYMKNWYKNRGWTAIPHRLDKSEKYGDEFVKLSKQGMSSNQIAKQYDLTSNQVLLILKKMGVEFPKSGRQKKVSIEMAKSWEQRISQGERPTEIAKAEGYHPQTIFKWLRKLKK